MQHEGDFSFREAWFHLLDEYPVKYEAERLPPPIVADLNGDGKKEVLVATHDAKIQVFFSDSLAVVLFVIWRASCQIAPCLWWSVVYSPCRINCRGSFGFRTMKILA